MTTATSAANPADAPAACAPSAVADMILTWTTGNGEPLVFEGDLIVYSGEFFRVEHIQASAIDGWFRVRLDDGRTITAIGYEQVAVRRYTEG